MVPIVTRAQWGAAFTIPGGRHVAPSERRWFVVHWPGSAVSADERAEVRAIERQHRQGQGWQAAPGYNFLVGRSGTIYEGCGRDVRGIHSPPRNTDGWGVCVLISVGENPPQAALNATRALYNWLNGVAGRTLGMTWHGQHYPTACAGPNLNAWVQRGMPAEEPTPAPPLIPVNLKDDYTMQLESGNTAPQCLRFPVWPSVLFLFADIGYVGGTPTAIRVALHNGRTGTFDPPQTVTLTTAQPGVTLPLPEATYDAVSFVRQDDGPPVAVSWR